MIRLLLIAAAIAVYVVPAGAADLMPTAQQTALVKKYCAVCHTDAANNGGLSLEHFDAASAPPSLMAMLLSKVTGGVSVETAHGVPSNTAAAALVDRKMKSGAMGAAGIPIPDKATIDAFIHALAAESAGATEWSVQQEPAIVASILREKPGSTGEARTYRLVVSCNPATLRGSMQLAWSPLPQRGTLAVSVDGKAAVSYRVEGSETMGNGSKAVTHGLAAFELTAGPEAQALPAQTLTISELFPGETVVFPFSSFPAAAYQRVQACFSGQSNR